MKDIVEILNKIRLLLNMEPTPIKETKVITMTSSKLADGTEIFYEGDVIAVDSACFTDALLTTPVADGEYTLESGEVIVIAGGIVTEIKPGVEPEEEVVVEEKVEETLSDVEKENITLKELLAELKSKLENFQKEEAKLKAEITKLSSWPSVEPLGSTTQEKRELTQIEKRLNSLNAIKKMAKK
jgi:hypothetical protein